MKAQERHELRENDLASFLQYGLWAFVKQNGSYILLALALAFLGFTLWRNYNQRQMNAQLGAWAEYNNLPNRDDLLDAFHNVAVNASGVDGQKRLEQMLDVVKSRPQRLREIIDAHDIKPLRAVCYLNMADFYHKLILLPELMRDMKLSRAEVLEKQMDACKGAIDAMPDDLMITAHGHLGIAAALEDMGEWDKAAAEYKILTDANGRFANSPWAPLAADKASKIDGRRNSPRLAALMPVMQPTPAPSLMTPGGGLNLGGGLNMGGTLGNPGGGTALPSGLMFDGLNSLTKPPASTGPSTAPAWQMNFGPLNLPAPMGPNPSTTQP